MGENFSPRHGRGHDMGEVVCSRTYMVRGEIENDGDRNNNTSHARADIELLGQLTAFHMNIISNYLYKNII